MREQQEDAAVRDIGHAARNGLRRAPVRFLALGAAATDRRAEGHRRTHREPGRHPAEPALLLCHLVHARVAQKYTLRGRLRLCYSRASSVSTIRISQKIPASLDA